ncbi:MAG: sigma-E processing peptidase SpoIIGA [Bacilli bacterium]
MIVYLDVVIFINFIFDLFLLMSVNSILKRHIKMYRMILGSLFGGVSILGLFIEFNSLTLFIFKIVISVIMLLISFGFKDIKYFFKNFVHLYLCSMILGGFMYFLNIQFSYKNDGLIFAYNGLSVNMIGIMILGPIILVKYIKENKLLKLNYNNYYECELYLDKKNRIIMNSFLDTGNKLKDPYSNKSIILINKGLIDFKNKKPVYVPYNTLENHGLLKCYKGGMLIINNKSTRNFLVGVSEQKIALEGVDCIINNQILEELL